MKTYINGTGNVSPQKTWDNSVFLEEVMDLQGRMLQCHEPEIDPGLDEKYLRRMSRLIRLGWIAARICLEEAGNPDPDAIITGSGRGSVMDSEKFLLSIYRNKENLLPPTPFIQSTHNALGAQIALLLKNPAYNMAYGSCSQAFEHALLDAMISLENGEKRNILLGGFEEITTNQFILVDRLLRWRKEAVNNLDLFKDKLPGTISGEGFTFFFLQNQPTENSYALVKDVTTLFSIQNTETITAKALMFLAKNKLEPGMVDWVFTGRNGDMEGDEIYNDVLSRVFTEGFNEAAWKHLSGEYLTSSAFGTWAAAKALKHQVVPEILRIKTRDNVPGIRNILVYNHFKNIHHSFILLSAVK
jgi:3-oxoacyl-(acyl-carrier-protein) synthase